MYIRYLYSIEPTYFFIWFQRFHPTASCIVCHQNAKKGKTKNLLQIIWQIIRSTFSHYLQCWDNTPHSCGICTTKKVWKRKIQLTMLLKKLLNIIIRVPFNFLKIADKEFWLGGGGHYWLDWLQLLWWESVIHSRSLMTFMSIVIIYELINSGRPSIISEHIDKIRDSEHYWDKFNRGNSSRQTEGCLKFPLVISWSMRGEILVRFPWWTFYFIMYMALRNGREWE